MTHQEYRPIYIHTLHEQNNTLYNSTIEVPISCYNRINYVNRIMNKDRL